MRQGQHNRRGRGRGSSNHGGRGSGSGGGGGDNRKHQNPLTRTFESNGPDVKIRGTPAHVAEKYVTLARDALSSGDPVLAENYLQHAEHYNRIILAYREQQAAQAEQTQNQPRQPRQGDDPQVEDGADGENDIEAAASPQPRSNDGPGRWNGNGNGERRPATPEGEAGERRQQRGPRGRRPGRGDRAPREAVEGSDQPDFLTRPIRRPRREEGSEADAGNDVETVATISNE